MVGGIASCPIVGCFVFWFGLFFNSGIESVKNWGIALWINLKVVGNIAKFAIIIIITIMLIKIKLIAVIAFIIFVIVIESFIEFVCFYRK